MLNFDGDTCRRGSKKWHRMLALTLRRIFVHISIQLDVRLSCLQYQIELPTGPQEGP